MPRCGTKVVHRCYPFTIRSKDRIGEPVRVKLGHSSKATGLADVRAQDGNNPALFYLDNARAWAGRESSGVRFSSGVFQREQCRGINVNDCKLSLALRAAVTRAFFLLRLKSARSSMEVFMNDTLLAGGRLSDFRHLGRSGPQSVAAPPPRRATPSTIRPGGRALRLKGRRAGPIILLAGFALAAASLTAPEEAHAGGGAICSVLSHHPCLPYVPGVLSRRPFTPYSCGATGGPCSPEVVLRFGELPVLRIAGHAGRSDPIDRDHRLSELNEVAHTLSQCLELPPDSESQAGMEVALKLAFKRDGELMPDPRFTYTTHEAPENVKAAYHTAVLDMLKHCTPLPVTDTLGGAIAGRPLIVAVKDTRDLNSGGRRGDAAPPAQQGDTTNGDATNAGPSSGEPKP
jgi:hypothetical protein